MIIACGSSSASVGIYNYDATKVHGLLAFSPGEYPQTSNQFVNNFNAIKLYHYCACEQSSRFDVYINKVISKFAGGNKKTDRDRSAF